MEEALDNLTEVSAKDKFLEWYFNRWTLGEQLCLSYIFGASLGLAVIGLGKTANHFIESLKHKNPATSLEQALNSLLPEARAHQATDLPTIPGFEDDYFNQYDFAIQDYTHFWNNYFEQLNLDNFTPLDPLRVKAMLMLESAGHPEAYRFDPLQIANSGDYALAMLRDGEVNGKHEFLIDLLRNDDTLNIASALAGIQNTPRADGRWAYDQVPQDARIRNSLSLFYGIAWLWTRAVKVAAVKEGDTITSYTPSSQRSWQDATRRYNGRQVYADRVDNLVDTASHD
jgi:hypothetical protein